MDREMDKAEQQMSKKKDAESTDKWDKRTKKLSDDKKRSRILSDDRRRSLIRH